MVDLLERVHRFVFARPYQRCPNDIGAHWSLTLLYEMKSGGLQSINHTVVSMSLATYSERQVRVGHELILGDDLYLVGLEGSLHVQEWRVVEKD